MLKTLLGLPIAFWIKCKLPSLHFGTSVIPRFNWALAPSPTSGRTLFPHSSFPDSSLIVLQTEPTRLEWRAPGGASSEPEVLESRGAGEGLGLWESLLVTRKHSLEPRTTGWITEARAGVFPVCLELPPVDCKMPPGFCHPGPVTLLTTQPCGAFQPQLPGLRPSPQLTMSLHPLKNFETIRKVINS